MQEIICEHNPAPEKLEQMNVFTWPIWEKEASVFPWTYDSSETCYLLEGNITVTPDGGDPVSFQAGDLVTFPEKMSCTWEIHEAVRKHYRFD
jgi:uncharacterized cupin superfamily protein